MTDVIIAHSPQDARVLEDVQNHHAELIGALAGRVGSLTAAIAAGGGTAERDDLVRWSSELLLPHVRAEQEVALALATPDSGLRALLESAHRDAEALASLVGDLRGAEGVAAAVVAGALQARFAAHVDVQDDQVLPALAAGADASLAEAFAERSEILGGSTEGEQVPAGTGGHSCGCGEHDDAAHPELDARAIPHAIRHSTIFGALDAVRPGTALVLIAPHDPLPLLSQIDSRWPGAFEVGYLERGPEAWRLLFTRN